MTTKKTFGKRALSLLLTLLMVLSLVPVSLINTSAANETDDVYGFELYIKAHTATTKDTSFTDTTGNSSAIYDLVVTQNSSTSFTFTYQLAMAQDKYSTFWLDNETVTINDFSCDTDYYQKIDCSGTKADGSYSTIKYTYYLEISRSKGHKFSKWEPTYNNEDLDIFCRRDCEICDYAEYELHNFADATCEKGRHCTRCGVTVSEPVSTAHTFGAWSSNGDGTHTRTCKFNSEHTETLACSYSAATCTDSAKCTDCGHTTGEPNSENHTSTEVRYEQGENGVHNKYHACCNAFIEAENCSFSTATCTDSEKCVHCGYENGIIDKDNHTSTEFKYEQGENDVHNKYHACCNAFIETENCSYSTATCTASAKCTYCGRINGEPDSDNHTSTKFKYEKNSADVHNKYYACCNGFIETEEHTYDTNGKCTLCSYQCEHPSFTDGYCDKCNYKCTHPVAEVDICPICNEFLDLPKLVNGVYEIFTANQLIWFADFVNAGNTSVNAILMNDIVVNEGEMNEQTDSESVHHWSPIGNGNNRYVGTFDGNSKTVSGLYFNDTTTNYVGLFGYVNTDGVVKNTGVINSYLRGCDRVGGVVGSNFGTVANCYNKGRVDGESYIGGVVGFNYGTVERCYNTGTIGISGASGSQDTGGVVGRNNKTVKNCYNTGIVEGRVYVGGVVGSTPQSGASIVNCYNTGNATSWQSSDYGGGVLGYGRLEAVTNCYYLNTSNMYGINGTSGGDGRIEKRTAKQFASGEVAYLLQGTQEEEIWGQKIGEDTYPVFGGDKVYRVENCIGELAYSNANENGQHNFVNGFCTDCDAFEPATDENEDGVYEISNAGQLYWFADKVNNDNANFDSANAILTADIVVNEGVMTSTSTDARVWTPIGNDSNSYTGTFDGNNYTVSGLYFNNSEADYIGLFGYVGVNGAVNNTGVINSYFNGYYFVGGVVGVNAGTITNCYNTGTVSGDGHIGGVVGYNEGTVTSCNNTGTVNGSYNDGGVGGVAGFNHGTITNCYNTGTVSGGSQIGGMIGTNYSIINNCYNTGTVSGTDRVGGLVGYNPRGTIANCYNTGAVSGTEYIGGVVGNGFDSTAVTNCFYLDTTCTAGFDGEDIAGSAEAKTAEQFASGEVAYLLQGEQTEEIWGQKIGTDVLPSLGGDKVYAVTKCNGEVVSYNNTEGKILDHIDYKNGFCTLCGEYQPATLNEDGVYEIGNAGQLYWFAEYVNAGNTSANAILTDNIVVNEGVMTSTSTDARVWTPIGNNRIKYTGTFDGNDYTISGIYFNDNDKDYVGLFGVIGENGAVKNTGVINSYISGFCYVGSIVGYNYYGTVTNCYNIDSTVQGYDIAGGVVGLSFGTITNCYSTGKVNSGNAYGGVLGNLESMGIITNCYYLDTSCSGGIGDFNTSDSKDIEGSAEAKTVKQFKSGEVAYLLQGEQEELVWGQKIGTDTYPTLGGDKVYYGYTSCVYDSEMVYTNTEVSDVRPAHKEFRAEFTWDKPYDGECYVSVEFYCADCGAYVDYDSDYATLKETVEAEDCMHPGSELYEVIFEYEGVTYTDTKSFALKSDNHTGELVNGFCSECGGYQPATLNDNGTPDDEWDDYYEISNAGQLYWFGEVAAANDNYSKAVLTDDIIVNEDLTAENLREWIAIGESSSMPYCGTFDGQGHFISGLYAKSELNYIGLFGAIGWGASISNLGIKDSYFEGNYYVGGIVGYNDFSNVKNCYAENVEIVAVSSGAAVVGYNYGEVSNSYSTSDSFVGNNNYGTITNCYYLAGEEIHDEDGLTFKTAEQFASGEVAYLLQSGVVGEEVWDDELGYYVQTEPEHIWGQKIGEDTYPVFGGDKVYQVENCIGELAYSNANENGQHNFVNGFCTLCGGFEPATLNEDGVYEISNAGQLYWFAELVNSGNTSANAILTADIVVNEGAMSAESEGARAWTPIGNNSNRYTGTFDGNNKTVSGLYFNNTDTKYVGLFGYIGENGTVKNTGVINSYFNGLWFVGGVVGANYGTITNCYNTGEVSGVYFTGGIVAQNCGTITRSYNTGIIEGFEYIGGVVGSNNGTITNCYNTGEVSGSYEVGGVVGKNSEGIISNCYNTGEVSGANDYIGGVAGANQTGTITNCYYLDTAYAGGIGMNDTTKAEDIVGSAEAKTAEQFKGGEVAYLLQGEQTEEIWGQKIGTDAYPILSGDKVYYGYVSCAEDATAVYTNDKNATDEKPDHNFVNGFCTVCGGYEPATLNEDGVYEIGNAGQLYWFAELVNSGNTSANAILTADIVVNEGVMSAESEGARVWTPIGNWSNSYTGTFDGNGKTVSGLYCINYGDTDCVGLFGNIDNGTVKNAGVINSYFSGEYYAGSVVGYNSGTVTNCYNTGEVSGTSEVGGVVGYNDDGTIENCYNTGKVSSHWDAGGVVGCSWAGKITNCNNTGTVSGEYFVGGVAGYNFGGSTIENCYNTGTVSGKEDVGGVVGSNYAAVTNCYNTGTVKGNEKAGGVIGLNDSGTITNCYNTGDVSGTSDIGGVAGYNINGTVENCYYLDTAYAGGINGSDVVGSAEAKTAEQFESGEVAYLLQGEQEELVWGQKIGTDELPVLGGDKVYTVINCKDEVVGYSNTEGEILDHNFEDGFCTICGDMDGIAQVKGYSISLGGNIAVNYYMVLSDEVLADENAEMVFTVPDTGSTYEVRIPVSSVTPDANGYYVFTCEVAAKEMASRISAQIVTSNNESDVFEYSVKQYAEYILAKAEEANSLSGGGVAGGIAGGDGASNLLTPEMLSYVKAAPLVKAMLNYGANAQLYFDYNTDILANATLDEADKALADNLDLSEYTVSVTGSEEGIAFYGGALSLKSETAIKLYFVIEEGTAVPEVSVNGKAYELTKNGSIYELKIADIPAHILSEMYEIRGGEMTMNYGVFSYGYTAMGTDKTELKNAIKALYAYYEAAEMYIG